MRIFLTFFLSFLFTAVFGQVQSKTMFSSSGNLFSSSLFKYNDTIYIPVAEGSSSSMDKFIRLTEDLSIVDTLSMNEGTGDSVYYFDHLVYKNSLSIIKGFFQNGNYKYFREVLKNKTFNDSIYLKIDTIKRGIPYRFYPIDSNNSRAIISKIDTSGRWIMNSVIVELDSNLNITEYHDF